MKEGNPNGLSYQATGLCFHRVSVLKLQLTTTVYLPVPCLNYQSYIIMQEEKRSHKNGPKYYYPAMPLCSCKTLKQVDFLQFSNSLHRPNREEGGGIDLNWNIC